MAKGLTNFGSKRATPFGSKGKTAQERALEARRGSGSKTATEKRLERKRGVNPSRGD